jgi:hypothetical protein
MKTIDRVDFCYDSIRMPRLIRLLGGPIALGCALIFCLSAVTSIAAQRRRPARRAPATPRAQPRPPVAQTREPEVQLERLPTDPSVEAADIAITANVKARSLIFETVPNPIVEFPGKPDRDTVWEAQRENLPTPVQPGVTYRDIGIRLKITSVFRDIDRIVSEALGEIPVSDNLKEIEKKPSTAAKVDPPKPRTTASHPPPRER